MKKISFEVIVEDDIAQDVVALLQKIIINKPAYYNLKMEGPEPVLGGYCQDD